MIQAKLETIDRENLSCYLETGDEKNIAYYARYGFRVIHEQDVHGNRSYSLLRKSR